MKASPVREGALCLGLFFASALDLAFTGQAAAQGEAKEKKEQTEEEKPYRIVDGKVDWYTCTAMHVRYARDEAATGNHAWNSPTLQPEAGDMIAIESPRRRK